MEHAEETWEAPDGARLYFQHWWPESGPQAVVVLIHGIGEHSGRFRRLVQALVSRGHAVYALDLRGHGRSPGQRGHLMAWTEYREDVRAFVSAVAAREPGRPLFTYGHSMGGLIVLDYVLHHPEGLRGTVISAAPFESVGVATPLLVTLARILSRLWPRFSLQVPLEAAALSREPAHVADYLADPLVHRECSARWAVESLEANVWVKAHAADLRLPLLLVHGEEDRINTAAGARRFFADVPRPDKRMHLVPGGYHEPHNDPGNEHVFQEVDDFLRARSGP
ncbi:lysophospholipase [Archangium primigenium]|nr:lysophospholipase [Archangium primigenium]